AVSLWLTVTPVQEKIEASLQRELSSIFFVTLGGKPEAYRNIPQQSCKGVLPTPSPVHSSHAKNQTSQIRAPDKFARIDAQWPLRFIALLWFAPRVLVCALRAFLSWQFPVLGQLSPDHSGQQTKLFDRQVFRGEQEYRIQRADNRRPSPLKSRWDILRIC